MFGDYVDGEMSGDGHGPCINKPAYARETIVGKFLSFFSNQGVFYITQIIILSLRLVKCPCVATGEKHITYKNY
jgi:hypothetical protein